MDKTLRILGRTMVDDTGVTEKDPRRSTSAITPSPADRKSTKKPLRLPLSTDSATPFGIPMPGIVEAVLNMEDRRLWRSKGVVRAALGQERGVVLVSSLDSDAPVGMVSASLAAAMIVSERRPLALLDIEYPRHTLQQFVGYSSEAGLSDVLQGRHELAEVTVSARDPRVGFLPAGGRRPGLGELGSLKAGEIFMELLQTFDLLIAALPPGDDGSTEAVTAAASGLGLKVLVLVLSSEENPEGLRRFSTMVELAGGKVLGWIMV